MAAELAPTITSDHSAPPVVRFESVSMSYAGGSQRSEALDSATFTIQPGRVVGLVGPNGSGKTTLIKLVAGVYLPTSGDLSVFGKNPYRDAGSRARVGYLPAADQLLRGLTVFENLLYRAELRSLTKGAKDVVSALLDRYGLSDVAFLPSDALSSGQLRRLAFLSVQLGRPDLLFPDEPTTGVDIQALSRIHSDIAAFRGSPQTTMMATHHTEELFDLCDDLIALRDGKIVFSGSVSVFGDSYAVFKENLSALFNA